jgi:protein gp37
MNKTKIPWADWTWNPIVGCSPESAGCANCYAAAISKRFHLPWGSAHFMPERLDQPAKVRKPGRVFVCSMADIGHETVKPEWRDAVYAAMRSAPWHTFIVLTKRPGAWMVELPTGTWAGVTVEAISHWKRVDDLLNWHFGTAFVSVEPMLGPVTLRGLAGPLAWVIAGPETGPRARLCDDAWIDALAIESQCFFDKRDKWTRREFPIVD